MISKLYYLEPFGVATAYNESLTSYISRLAEAHCVTTGDLITKVIGPEINKSYIIFSGIKGGSRFYESSAALNGTGNMAEEFTLALKQLTLRNDLNNLTMLRWKNVTSSRELLKNSRAWCPICFNEMLTLKEVVYEPLIWNLKVVGICPKHKIRLQSKCHHVGCNQINFVLNRRSRAGYCSKCGGWLGQSISEIHSNAIPQQELEWQLWLANEVGQLLASNKSTTLIPTRDRIAQVTQNLINSFFNNNTSLFAKHIGVSNGTILGWKNGENIPTLNGLLKVSYCTGIPSKDLLSITGLTAKNIKIEKVPFAKPNFSKHKRESLNKEVLKEKLLTVLANNNEAPSMREVARRIDKDKRILYDHFPQLCKSISKRYIESQRLHKEKRIEATAKKVRQITLALYNKGIYPSRRKVEELLVTGNLREKPLRDSWIKSLKELRIHFHS